MQRHEAEEFVRHLHSFASLRHPLNLALARLESACVVEDERGDCGVVVRYQQAPFWYAPAQPDGLDPAALAGREPAVDPGVGGVGRQ